jgi:hypothetical protein
MDLHFVMAPMQFSDSYSQFSSDVLRIIAARPHVIGLTESSDRYDILLKLAREHEYRLVQPLMKNGQRASTALMFDQDFSPLKTGFTWVVDGDGRSPSDGGHGPRGFTWARVKYKGEVMWLAVTHLLTGGRTPADGKRYYQNQRIINALSRKGRFEARGRRLGFIKGDFNRSDYLLTIPGFVSMLDDEIAREVRSIDSIQRRTKDTRVETLRVRQWDRQNSDHAPWSVFVRIGA